MIIKTLLAVSMVTFCGLITKAETLPLTKAFIESKGVWIWDSGSIPQIVDDKDRILDISDINSLETPDLNYEVLSRTIQQRSNFIQASNISLEDFLKKHHLDNLALVSSKIDWHQGDCGKTFILYPEIHLSRDALSIEARLHRVLVNDALTITDHLLSLNTTVLNAKEGVGDYIRPFRNVNLSTSESRQNFKKSTSERTGFNAADIIGMYYSDIINTYNIDDEYLHFKSAIAVDVRYKDLAIKYRDKNQEYDYSSIQRWFKSLGFSVVLQRHNYRDYFNQLTKLTIKEQDQAIYDVYREREEFMVNRTLEIAGKNYEYIFMTFGAAHYNSIRLKLTQQNCSFLTLNPNL